MSGRTVGRPEKWTEEKIMEYLVTVFLERGKITPNRGIYVNLLRRVRGGEFGSTKEATERLWFCGLVNININRAAEWLIDTAHNGDRKSVKRLYRLIDWEEDNVRKVLREIFRPNYPVAGKIVEGFAASRRGKRLRELISVMGLDMSS